LPPSEKRGNSEASNIPLLMNGGTGKEKTQPLLRGTSSKRMHGHKKQQRIRKKEKNKKREKNPR